MNPQQIKSATSDVAMAPSGQEVPLTNAMSEALSAAISKPNADQELREQILGSNEDQAGFVQTHKSAFLSDSPEDLQSSEQATAPVQPAHVTHQATAGVRSRYPGRNSSAQGLSPDLAAMGEYAAKEVKQAIQKMMAEHTEHRAKLEVSMRQAQAEAERMAEMFRTTHEKHMEQVTNLTREVEELRLGANNVPKSKIAKVTDMLFTAAVIVNAGWIVGTAANRLYDSYKQRQSEHSVVGTPGSDDYA